MTIYKGYRNRALEFDGCCKAFYKEDIGPAELIDTVFNCFLRNVYRDSLSGWRAYIDIKTSDKLIYWVLKIVNYLNIINAYFITYYNNF